MKFILVKALLIFGYLTSFAENNPTYFFVVAKKGDGALSLLRKYRLDEYECNINQFYRINKLKKKEHLQLNKKYKLPMLVYEFNDVNIRTTIDNDNYELAKQVEAYNEKMLADKIKKSSFKFDKQLWVPFHIFNCEELVKVAPDSPNNNRSFPIFGKAYEYVPIEDKSLSGRVFYIVSGHGGPDPGAMGKHGSHTLCEDEYAYDVALRLVRMLTQHGATAYMITRDDNDGIRDERILLCDDDEVNWDKKPFVLDQKSRLQQRIDVINKLYFQHKKRGVTDQRLIEIHIDSRAKKERADVFFYFQPNSKKGQKLALKLFDKMSEKYKRYRPNNDYKGKVQARGLYMLQWSKPISVYIELANIRNAADQKRIVEVSNRQLLAQWLFEGLN